MIGFEITAVGYDEDSKQVHRQTYGGLFEGSPKIEAKVKERAAQAVTMALAKGALNAIGVAAGGPLKVVDIVSKPLRGMGAAIGEFIAKEITAIHQLKAENCLNLCDVRVTLQGDFVGSYVIEDPADLRKLPTMLELTAGRDGQYLGESVIATMLSAHRNFILKHCPLSASGKRKVLSLDLKVEL